MIKAFEFYFDFTSPYTLIAHKKGIFGVPSFIINNKIFWGQDRSEFV
tara:strand:+ start:303 stop:443 length:141 start_codon:yes stop_codon:yes gene_type:complete